MIYICDFFKRHKEAISNQIELLAINSNSEVIAATRFMGQKSFQKDDRKDKIYIYPPAIYNLLLPLKIINSCKEPVHYFEEEASSYKRFLFNSTKTPLYISMYRRPTSEYIEHIKKYKYLEKIFVELDYHRDILVNGGISKDKVMVAHTPAKIASCNSTKEFSPSEITLAFASWNNSEPSALEDRGMIYLLDLLKKTPGARLEIALRDNKINGFNEIARKLDVIDRVSLNNIANENELLEMFKKSDFVAFCAQKRVVKDVPNSLLDGLMLSKPVIITDILDFSRVVTKNNIGITIETGSIPTKLVVSKASYKEMSANAFRYSKLHTPDNYLRILESYK